jgi:glutamine phosphoribosylpyrophosphate amidotransferase
VPKAEPFPFFAYTPCFASHPRCSLWAGAGAGFLRQLWFAAPIIGYNTTGQPTGVIGEGDRMCGVLGFVDKRHRLSDAEHDRLWRRMISAIAHRGGEGDGVYRSAAVTLAHTRLRILDINPASDQPFFSNQCHGVLCFNGQIYNHQELKQQLSRDFVYRANSDTETLLYAYVRWGQTFVHALRGMYAFGIWDKRERRIVLGVDFLGIKPLYYLNDENFFAWSYGVPRGKDLAEMLRVRAERLQEKT